MGLSIPLLETFILVASLGSFGAAARRLGLTQPAVSYQIKSLEQELGAPLIDRSRSKMMLTPAGRTAYKHATRIMSDYELMMADIPRTTGEIAGTLLIGCSTISGNYLLPPLVSGFKQEHPRVSIALEIADSSEVVERLKNEQVELAFTTKMSRDPKLWVRRFAEDELVLIVPTGHRLIDEEEVPLDVLRSVPIVYRKSGSGTRRTMEQVMVDHGMRLEDLDVVAEMSTNQSVMTAVQSGLGVSVISRLAAEGPAAEGKIVVIEFSDISISRKIYVMRRKNDALSMAAETFLEFCLD